MTQLQKTGQRTFGFHVAADTVAPGDKVYIGIRGGLTLHTHNSSRSRYCKITVHGASFMAVTEFDGLGGHSYDGVAVKVRDVVVADPPAMCAGGQRLCQGILASNADCCAHYTQLTCLFFAELKPCAAETHPFDCMCVHAAVHLHVPALTYELLSHCSS